MSSRFRYQRPASRRRPQPQRMSGFRTASRPGRARLQAARMQFRAAPPPVFGRTTGELKGVDTELALDPVIATTSTNASMFSLNLVTPGTGSYNRIGRKIHMRSVRLRGTLSHVYDEAVTTGNLIGNYLRMVVVYDAQPQGAVPTFDTIFGSTVADATESSDQLDALRFDNTSRFRVIKDCVVQMNPDFQNAAGGTTDLVSKKYYFDEYVKLNNLETLYSGQSSPTTIADVASGGLYVFFRALFNTTDTNFVQVNGDAKARLRYVDI